MYGLGISTGVYFKFGEDRKKLPIGVENFMDWLANKNPTWTAYCAFTPSHQIALDKQPSVCPVGISETWRRLFAKCVLKVSVPKGTNACQDDHPCDRLKAGIDGAIHGVQAIWDANLSKENWGFYLLMQKIR